jgi:hypothetical protein
MKMKTKEEKVTLGPGVREGDHVFGVALNDTFIVSVFFLTSMP